MCVHDDGKERSQVGREDGNGVITKHRSHIASRSLDIAENAGECLLQIAHCVRLAVVTINGGRRVIDDGGGRLRRWRLVNVAARRQWWRLRRDTFVLVATAGMYLAVNGRDFMLMNFTL